MGFWSGLEKPRETKQLGSWGPMRASRVADFSGFYRFLTFYHVSDPMWTLLARILSDAGNIAARYCGWAAVVFQHSSLVMASSTSYVSWQWRSASNIYLYILIGWSHPFQCRYITQTGGQKDQPLQELHRNNPWHSPWISPFLSAPRLWARAISLPDLGGVCSRCCGTGWLQSKAVLNTTKFGSQMFLGRWRCAGFHDGDVQRFAEISGRRWVQLW